MTDPADNASVRISDPLHTVLMSFVRLLFSFLAFFSLAPLSESQIPLIQYSWHMYVYCSPFFLPFFSLAPRYQACEPLHVKCIYRLLCLDIFQGASLRLPKPLSDQFPLRVLVSPSYSIDVICTFTVPLFFFLSLAP